MVGILVLHYRRNPWTEGCLLSLRQLRDANYRVILVDNGSQDGSGQELQHKFPEVDFVPIATNCGFGGGNNQGARRAQELGCTSLWILNNDTRVFPDSLSALLACQSGERDAVGSVLFEMDSDPQRLQLWGGGRVDLHTGDARYSLSPSEPLDYITGASLLISSQTFFELGGFDERFFLYWEDSDLCWRLKKLGGQLKVAPRSRVLHRGGGSMGGHHSPFHDYHMTLSSVHFYRRHAPWPLLPTFCFAARRILWRLRTRNWPCVLAVLRAMGRAWLS